MKNKKTLLAFITLIIMMPITLCASKVSGVYLWVPIPDINYDIADYDFTSDDLNGAI